MPQVSFGKQRSSRLFRFYLSSPATPFLSSLIVPRAASSGRRFLPPPGEREGERSVDGQILNFSPSCVPITGARGGGGGGERRKSDTIFIPSDCKILQSPDRDFYRRSFLFFAFLHEKIDTKGRGRERIREIFRKTIRGATLSWTPSISPRPRENYS